MSTPEPTMTLRHVATILLFATAGCGGAHMANPDADAFAALATEVSAAAEKHRRNMDGAGAVGCSTEMSRYGAEVRPMLDRMSGMSGGMDACMAEMGQPESGDMQSTCDDMRRELEAHLASGCAAVDPRAETARHAGAMRQMAAHETQRAASMDGMMAPRASMMSGRCSH
jgi:hypothetical protein